MLVGALFSFRLFLRYLRFLFGDHFGELGFALLSRFSVDVEFLALTVWQSWIKSAFPEVIVYLIDASGARLANLSRDGLGMGLCGLVLRVYGRVCALLVCLLYLGHLRVRAADLAVDIHRRLHLHRIGDMTINVECGLGADVVYHSGESLDIHLGYKDSENKHSFPDYTEEKAKYLYDVLVGIADYVIVDCMSIPDSNFLTSVTDLSYERSIFLCKNKKVAVSGKNNADAEAHIWRFCVC